MSSIKICTSWPGASNNYNGLTLVIGNVSCDLDSAVSALTYAAYLHWHHKQIECKVNTKTHREDVTYKCDIFVPILNVERQDYDLKTEVVYALNEKGIAKDMLVFRDDHDLKCLIVQSKSCSIVLVDHHVLCDDDAFMAPYVKEVVDHRPLDANGWKYKEDCTRTVELVGSCCTLVTQRIRERSALLDRGGDFFAEFEGCADLLHSTIILDTVNFSKEVDKAKPKDEQMVLYLEHLLKYDDCHMERRRKLESLVRARSDVSSLSAGQLLRKDAKVVGGVLVPTFPILVKVFLERAGALAAVNEALKRSGCTIAVLLGMDLEGGLRRDGAVYSPREPARAVRMVNFLKDWKCPPLGLEVENGSGSDCLYFVQKNLAASRKQYMPALQDFQNA